MHNLSLIESLAMNANQALYPIREVSRLTGVNAITLRAWERRYGLIEPVRTDSGHRLYTDEHVQAIKCAVELSQQGVPISQVKSVLDQRAESEHLTQIAEFEELESRLKLALQKLHMGSLQEALDNLFIEVDETSVLHLLARFDLLQKPAEQNVLWQSALLPRLYSRLRFAQKRLISNRRNKTILVVESRVLRSPVAKALAGLWILQHGMQPLMVAATESLPEMKQLKALDCVGAVFLAQSSLQEFADYGTPIYPALDCLVLLMQPSSIELQAAVQVEQLRFSELFASKYSW
ncbi:hypothetical protein THMIRHAS_21590 [Thiosulfatimonas sediminis]|uniref:HTH merR-type domain-containing protein n=1 Tax=Thiosulfatimonas sediminis TaxID=2675054 RepID=A0A6F8PXG4_9GAMM|nr:MerR family transcriptional regulator [Thiosulfatimonas sediminis]BBP46786.1 hypothetical protein THMIRHAS_21590 [Thiosulfatimonas sediminis]